MWLRKLVAISMIITFVGMNGLVVLGLLAPKRELATANGPTAATVVVEQLPTITLSVKPGAIQAGATAGISWETTNSPKTCTASGGWSGPKTAYGSESTGRIKEVGTAEFILTCENDAGEVKATTKLKVTAAPPPAAEQEQSSSSESAPTGPLYCQGRLPCYSASQIAQHSGNGDCWGWNGDRVINISGFDAAYHIAKSGVSNIQISSVCGKDLAPSLNGSVSAGGKTRDHTAATKNNSERNEIPYFIGYFDSAKP